jgi:hypothetical protein
MPNPTEQQVQNFVTAIDHNDQKGIHLFINKFPDFDLKAFPRAWWENLFGANSDQKASFFNYALWKNNGSFEILLQEIAPNSLLANAITLTNTVDERVPSPYGTLNVKHPVLVLSGNFELIAAALQSRETLKPNTSKEDLSATNLANVLHVIPENCFDQFVASEMFLTFVTESLYASQVDQVMLLLETLQTINAARYVKLFKAVKEPAEALFAAEQADGRRPSTIWESFQKIEKEVEQIAMRLDAEARAVPPIVEKYPNAAAAGSAYSNPIPAEQPPAYSPFPDPVPVAEEVAPAPAYVPPPPYQSTLPPGAVKLNTPYSASFYAPQAAAPQGAGSAAGPAHTPSPVPVNVPEAMAAAHQAAQAKTQAQVVPPKATKEVAPLTAEDDAARRLAQRLPAAPTGFASASDQALANQGTNPFEQPVVQGQEGGQELVVMGAEDSGEESAEETQPLVPA